MQIAIGDYNADGRPDIGAVETGNGLMYWFVIGLNNTVIVNGVQFGQANAIVLGGDYDGDARADLAVHRPSNQVFYYRSSVNNLQNGFAFGASDDFPLVGGNQSVFP